MRPTLTVRINVTELGKGRALEGMQEALADTEGLYAAMGAGVETSVRDHLVGINGRSPNTDFYGSAARGVEVESDDKHALVRIPKLGFPLRYYGGTVLPGKSISSFTGEPTRALALPSDKVPVVGPPDGRHRQRPGDYAGLLAFIPTKSDKSVGVLVQGFQDGVKSRGKNKGKPRIKPLPGGDLLYVLATSATHEPDESILPTLAEMSGAARDAAVDHLDSYTEDLT